VGRDRNRGRAQQLAAQQRIEDRAATRRDDVARICAEHPDETRPPLKKVQQLAIPIHNLGEWIHELEYRYPTLADMRAVQHLDEETHGIDIVQIMLERLTPLRGEGIEQMASVDMMEAGRIIAGFNKRQPSLKVARDS